MICWWKWKWKLLEVFLEIPFELCKFHNSYIKSTKNAERIHVVKFSSCLWITTRIVNSLTPICKQIFSHSVLKQKQENFILSRFFIMPYKEGNFGNCTYNFKTLLCHNVKLWASSQRIEFELRTDLKIKHRFIHCSVTAV